MPFDLSHGFSVGISATRACSAMLDWLEAPDLRQRCQAGLNKSEQRHVLAQVICTFKQGAATKHSSSGHRG